MAPRDPHRPSGAPARDLRAVLGPGQAHLGPSLPSSLLVPLIVTVISTWSEAQSWSLLLFLPLLSPASQLLADVCVCVSTRDRATRTWRRRGRPHAGYATQPLSREGPLLYFHLWCSPSQCKYQLGQAAWLPLIQRYSQGKSPILSLKTSDL